MISTQICTLNFRSLPPLNDTWNAAQVFDGRSNGVLSTFCSMIRIKSVGCGVLDVVGRCVGGVDGRSVGSAAAKTAPKIEKNANGVI